MENNKKFLFVLAGIWTVAILGAFTWVSISKNRIFNSEKNIRVLSEPRKTIVDRHNEVLAFSKGNKRVYPHGPVTVHSVGFVDPTKGIGGELEMGFGPQLTESNKFRWFFLRRPEDIIKTQFRSSLDLDVLRAAYEALGQQKGAVVVMEASTGAILAMISKPDFLPTVDAREWKNLQKRKKDAPLLNRAMRGRYEPGSVIKLITAALLLDKPEVPYYCSGSIRVGDRTIPCANNHSHGHVATLRQALAVSCNGYFISRGLHEVAIKDFYDLVAKVTGQPVKENVSRREYILNLYGQGNINLTPLHAAQLAAAIANKGLMPQPVWQANTSGSTRRIFTDKTAERLKSMMGDVVLQGTGRGLSGLVRQGFVVGVKTGTAEKNRSDGSIMNIAWTVGFAGKKTPEYVFSVVIEESQGMAADTAVPVARRILQALLSSRKEV